eukprot:CAMPEP_0170562312 /NCGR_PEP_ID=MMETSP0211-20121228/59870_1 /TAXON_ID=311385 /ORGANISM="Pseudokeronopsis sp., Strain OXSARD2" /LENGTH=62 /DNA_ID=CAMNT_0010879015 /DNA_START=445 /DNA_END=633 /DNA_ORIENTATION=-
MKQNDLFEHFKTCPMVTLTCQICDAEVAKKDLENHDCIQTLKKQLLEKDQAIYEKDNLIRDL